MWLSILTRPLSQVIEFFNEDLVSHYFELHAFMMPEIKLDIKVSEHLLELVKLDMDIISLLFT